MRNYDLPVMMRITPTVRDDLILLKEGYHGHLGYVIIDFGNYKMREFRQKRK